MHVIEAVGIHWKVTYEFVTDECRRTTFWIAKLLNTWISFEYGWSRVLIRCETCQSLTLNPHDGMIDLLKIFNISLVLDPDRDSDSLAFKAALNETAELKLDRIPLILSQTDLCFALYRRLRLQNLRVHSEIASKVLSTGRRGMQVALEALESNQPWWHVSNAPFQFACILLAMDTAESLSLVGIAVSTLRQVVSTVGSGITCKALTTVEQFVQLSRLRKEREAKILTGSMLKQKEVVDVLQGEPALIANDELIDDMWAEGVLWDTPTLGGVDWNQLWIDFYAST